MSCMVNGARGVTPPTKKQHEYALNYRSKCLIYIILRTIIYTVYAYTLDDCMQRLINANIFGGLFGTYRAWWARVQCRRASRSEPVAAVGPCSRTGRPTAESRRMPSDWRHKTATCPRRTLRQRSGPRTIYVRLSNTISQAKAKRNMQKNTRRYCRSI